MSEQRTFGPDLSGLPWERGGAGFANFFRTWWLIIRHPVQALGDRPPEFNPRPALVFAILAFVLPQALVSLIAASGGGFSPLVLLTNLGEVLFRLLYISLGLLVMGVATHGLIRLLEEDPAPLTATFRALAYATSAMALVYPLGLITAPLVIAHPGFMSLGLLGLLGVLVYTLYVFSIGLDAAHRCGRSKAGLIMVLPLILFLVAMMLTHQL